MMKIGDMIESTKERTIFLGSEPYIERRTQIGDLFIITDFRENEYIGIDDKYRISIDLYDIKSGRYAPGFYLFDVKDFTKIVE